MDITTLAVYQPSALNTRKEWIGCEEPDVQRACFDVCCQILHLLHYDVVESPFPMKQTFDILVSTHHERIGNFISGGDPDALGLQIAPDRILAVLTSDA
jgi:hypothetical protein